jgi:FtsZ-interacting cell division protein YlmF
MSFLDGVLRFFGADDYEQDSERIVEYPGSATEHQASLRDDGDGAVISMPESEATFVYVVRPERDESGQARYNLKAYKRFLQERRALVLDLSELAKTDLNEAERLVDYLAGAVDMVDGEAREITKNVFIFAPSNVRLAGDPLRPVEVG